MHEFTYLDPKQSTITPLTRAHSWPIIIKIRFLSISYSILTQIRKLKNP